MCGRYTITRQEGLVEDFQAVLDVKVGGNEWWKPRFNVAPTQDAPVVRVVDGTRTIEMMRWGLVPFWAGKSGAKPPLMINARIESLEKKAVFRDALERKRCLVPADGFYEWKKLGKQKQPMYIHPTSHSFFAFAGLWARAKLETGELHSFTIVTGPPNHLVESIHDRMPVILDRSAWEAWLDPATDIKAAHALLGVPSDEGWAAEPVSTWVNVANHDDAKCIEPLTAPPPTAQGSLF